jgi:hypothetical protein
MRSNHDPLRGASLTQLNECCVTRSLAGDRGHDRGDRVGNGIETSASRMVAQEWPRVRRNQEAALSVAQCARGFHERTEMRTVIWKRNEQY